MLLRSRYYFAAIYSQLCSTLANRSMMFVVECLEIITTRNVASAISSLSVGYTGSEWSISIFQGAISLTTAC